MRGSSGWVQRGGRGQCLSTDCTSLRRLCVLVRLLPNLLLLLLVLCQDGDQIFRDGLVELYNAGGKETSNQIKLFFVNESCRTLNDWLNLTSSAIRLSISLFMSACFFFMSLSFSFVTKLRKAGNGSAEDYKEDISIQKLRTRDAISIPH